MHLVCIFVIVNACTVAFVHALGIVITSTANRIVESYSLLLIALCAQKPMD